MATASHQRHGQSWRLVLSISLALILLLLAMTQGAAISGAAASTPVTFAVIGDYGSDSSNEAAVRTLVDSWSPSFVATVGDNFYNAAIDSGDTGNKYYESAGKYYCRYMKDVAGASTCATGSAAVNGFFPAMGNHDYSDATPSPTTYTDFFTLPGSGVVTSGSSGNERYYDFVEGPVHFFVINSNTAEPSGTSSTSAQAHWLQTQLAASTATWNLVLFHHPPYSSDSTHGSTTYMQWPFAQWGADAVLAGHAHDYERIARDGIVYFVNGLGGDSRYSFGTPVTGSAFRYNSNFGAQRVTATDTSLKFEFISVDGVVQDTYTISAGQSPTATPTSGAVATATATSAPTKQATPTATAVPPMATAAPTATPGASNAVTVAFQNGSAPSSTYSGGDDTYISQANPTTNYGGSGGCLADGDDPIGTGKDLSCLLRWDISSIPAGSTVTGASITLNVTNASGGSYPIYQVLRPWAEAGANWNVYASGQAWSVPGALGSQDRGTTALGTVAASSTGSRTFNLNSAGIAAIQSWINTPGSNHGLIIADSSITDGADFASNESGTATNRPKLTIQYQPASGSTQAMPTPTKAPATATPTPTAAITQPLHVGNLDGSTAKSADLWSATVAITVHDAMHNPRAGALVTGSWSAGATGTASCTTGTNGTCTVTKPSLSASTKSVQYSVTNVTAAGTVYDSTANHDPDGDSDGTTIVVSW